MIIWVTKYALTQGIIEVDADASETNGMASYRPDAKSAINYVHGNDWWARKEDALLRAEEMRIKKLLSLDRQMKKISALTF